MSRTDDHLEAAYEGVTIISSLDQIPQFASETEEAAWWATHELSVDLWRSLPPAPEDELPPVRQEHRQPPKRAAG